MGKMNARMEQIATDMASIPEQIKNLILDAKQTPGSPADSGVHSNPPFTGRKTEPVHQNEDNNEAIKPYFKRVELPTFEGEDPLGWIARAEQFFTIQQVEEAQKLRLALICMEGGAVHWFQFWMDKTMNPTWDELVQALLRRYGDGSSGDVFERLATIKQRNGVKEYIQEFELLVAQARGTPERQLLGYFMAGLRSNIRNHVRPHEPKELVRAMEIARYIEEAVREHRSPGVPNFRGNGSKFNGNRVVPQTGSRNDSNGSKRNFSQNDTAPRSTASTAGSNAPASKVSPSSNSNSHNRGSGVRFLPQTEFERRRDAGLCFTCGKNYTPGHRCPEKNLRLVILGENEGVNTEGEVVNIEEVNEGDKTSNDEEVEELQQLELSRCSSQGVNQPNTMKLMVEVNKIPALALVDTGASHVFISKRLVQAMGVQADEERTYKVRLGDGNRKRTRGFAKDLFSRWESMNARLML